MKNQKMWKNLVIGLCLSALTGCSAGADEKTEGGEMYGTEYQSGVFDDEEMDAEENVSTENEDNSRPDGNGTNGVDTAQEKQKNTTADDAAGKVDANSLYTSATLTGSVVEFSDGSCTVSADVTEDDGETIVSAAPGYESEDTNVVVTYEEGCVVQIATIYTTAEIAELEQASVSDIKKQASVIIYGSYTDTHHVSADRIIICHRTA